MITTNLGKKYEKLFEEAYELLVTKNKLNSEDHADILENGRFTSMEEYFMFIGDLAQIHSENIQASMSDANKSNWNASFAKYSKFLMLPIDEDYFSINANTRTITIPQIFSTHGVSLAGDQRAETLLFEIDRYFDFVDLLRTNIYIQWVGPNGEPGATLVSLIDYDDTKIRFGWVLSDHVTTTGNGILTFSVRFFMRDDLTNVINYSLNTLPISVKVRPALRVDIENNYTDEDPYLFTRAIVNGANSNVDVLPEQPEIGHFSLYYEHDGKVYLENDTARFEFGAYTNDLGSLKYKWTFVPSNGSSSIIIDENTNTADLGVIVNLDYVLTKDTKVIEGKTYYYEEDNAKIKFEGTAFDPEKEYYE